MNNVILIGRLVADPELKTTHSGIEVTSFRIAVDRPYSKDGEKKADFIDIVAWRKTAAFICQYFTKGKPIVINGSLQTRSYETKDGSKRFVTEVLADNVEFAPSTKNNGNTGAQGYSQQAYTAPEPAYSAPAADATVPAQMDNLLEDAPSEFTEMNLDDDLPF